jgi:SET domain-containing protein
MGLFAEKPIEKGETVIICGGTIFTNEDMKTGRAREQSALCVGENMYLGNLSADPVTADEFLNHSCDPNLWIEGEAVFVARRDIDAGEELTGDYGTWDADPAWKLGYECNCGSSLCRRLVTGNDWQLPELQERYGSHFTLFLNERIRKLHERR